MNRSALPRVAFFVLLVAASQRATFPQALDHPARRSGLGMETGFSTGAIDALNLYNGNLVLAIPLGQRYPVGGSLSYGLTVYYNSNVWKHLSASVAVPFTGESPYTGSGGLPSIPGFDTHNAGAGWRLSVGGFLAPPNDGSVNVWNQDPDHYVLIEPDGTRRTLYESLHPGESFDCAVWKPSAADPQFCEDALYYTRDGSYLRARILGTFEPPDGLVSATVESPDGITRFFNSGGTVTKIADNHTEPNEVTIAYTDATGQAGKWNISDSHGRTHTIQFIHDPDPQSATHATHHEVDFVEMAAFGGSMVTFDFDYAVELVENPLDDSVLVEIPVLSSLTIEDAGQQVLGQYTMAYDTTYDVSIGGPGFYSGAINAIILPTGGRLEWDYRAWQVAGCGLLSEQNVEGVARKRAYDFPGTVLLGEWEYENGLTLAGAEGYSIYPNETFTRVTHPRRDPTDPNSPRTRSLHYFGSQDRGAGVPFCELDELYNGLPFSPDRTDQGTVTGMKISSAVYDGLINPADLTQNRVRRQFFGYNADPDADYRSGNQRLEESRTIYDDDGGKFTAVSMSSFDGLGHYRTVNYSDNFVAGGSPRTVTTNFNPDAGTYTVTNGVASGDFVVPPSTNAWILTDFESTEVTEAGSVFSAEYCFDPSTGALEKRRVLSSSSGGRSPSDVLELFVRDDRGNVVGERFFGGDLSQGVDPAKDVCDDFGLGVAQADYALSHDYQHGVLKASRYLATTGASVGFELVDRTIDLDTGLVASERDVSGQLQTIFGYDALSRLTKTDRPEGACTTIEYQPAQGLTRAEAIVKERAGSCGTATTTTTTTLLDGFGRVYREDMTLPPEDGAPRTARRSMAYNAEGVLLTSREWGASGEGAGVTVYDDHDAFGRPTIIYPPDDNNHRINIDYDGDRLLRRKTRIATLGELGENCIASPVDERCSETLEESDRFGRLVAVTEPSGDDGLNVRTSYQYDGMDHLTQVKTTEAIGSLQQRRLFEWDGRGFLRCERHPEKGVSGDGWTRYEYDAGGNVRRRYEATGGALDCGTSVVDFDHTLGYDRAERLTSLAAAGVGTLKSWTYGTSGRRLGRLATATRHNYLPVSGGPTDLVVSEEYFYDGIDGRISERRTTTARPGFTQRWTQSFTWTALGDPNVTTYPCEADGSWACTQTPVPISHSYTNGWLSGLPGWLTSIAYHDNGMLDTVTFANGAAFQQGADPDGMQRPNDIRFAPDGNVGTAGSNAFTYDGAGNVKSWADQTFCYDLVNRLLEHTIGSAGTQTYEYDEFANLTGITRDYSPDPPIPPINKLTNRFSLATYDAAGSMVTTPAGVMLDFDELSMLRHHAHPYVDEYYVHTADDERIATLRPGEEERWRLRSLDGAVLEEFRYDSVSGSGCTEPVDVQGVVISSQVEYFACNTLTAGPNVTITATGDATFRSLGSVAITGSFTVQSGGKLTITGDAPLGTPGSLLARKRYLYAAGYLVAMESALQGRAYVVPNWLGSPTVVLDDGSPTTVDTHFDFGFGEELQGSTQSAGFDSDMRFTGHERDYHTHADSVPWDLDLDYMHARHYSPLYGRLLTVDPAYGGSFADPQSWNRYSYARNNPIRFVDPDGRSAVGWVVKILRNRKIMVRPIHSNREFAYLQRQGVDVMATTRARARSGTLSAQRGRGRPVQDPAHPERGTGSLEGRDPHYHMSGRPSGAGHSFWRRGLATVTFSYWASERGATAQGFAGVADLFNPLSLFNDVAELTDLASDPDVLSDLILRIRGGDEELPNGIVTMEFSFSPPFWFFIPLSGL